MTEKVEPVVGNLNVLIMGQTGVGKSSLINYIFDQNIRETGTGKPVTPKVFEGEYKRINDVPITLIDSWGLEQGKDEEWQKLLREFMVGRGVDKKVEEWVHVVLFCINASSNRIQDFEIKIINDFIDRNIEVVVALTKSGLCSPDTLLELEKALQAETKKKVVAVPVNSKKETLFGGMEIEQFGKEDITKAMRGNYLEMLRLRLPARISRLLQDKIHEYGKAIHSCDKTKEASELAEEYSKSFWQKDVEAIIVKELTDALASYVQLQTISMDSAEIFKSDFDYKKVIAGIGTTFGIGQVLRTVVMFINPIVGVVATVITAASLYSLFKNRADQISSEFINSMEEQLFANEKKLHQIVIDCVNSTEKEVKQLLLEGAKV